MFIIRDFISDPRKLYKGIKEFFKDTNLRVEKVRIRLGTISIHYTQNGIHSILMCNKNDIMEIVGNNIRIFKRRK